MISTMETGRAYFVEANDPRLIEDELNAAVAKAVRHAMEEGRFGIMVTRHAYTKFTVAVSPEVAYGQTLERDASAMMLAV